MEIYHINCVEIESPLGSAIGHCLLLEEDDKLVLVDCGIGLKEVKNPDERLGREYIDETGYVLREERTAFQQIQESSFRPNQVEHIICSHLDPDHIGGAADFPGATMHISREEYDAFHRGNERYLPQQLGHNPALRLYSESESDWFGLESRKIKIEFAPDIYLIPLPGHTEGHCGVAIQQNEGWLFYVGDAYYLRAELDHPHHPVDQLAVMRAEDNEQRLKSLNKVRNLLSNHPEIVHFGYHDSEEFEIFK